MALSLPAQAGGLMTNTNYHVAFDRMMARGASTDIDAIYSNPAGLVWGHEGWQVSFNWQMAMQERDIESYSPLHTDEGHTHLYNGKATASFVPAAFASYKHDRWAFSGMFGIVGGGGKAEFDEGIPMFTVPLKALMTGLGMSADQYNIDAKMKGRQFIYGFQLGAAYRINDWLSASLALRLSYYDGNYAGHVFATPAGSELKMVNVQLDCDQMAWRVAPIIGINFHKDRLTLAAKYEFRARFNVKNTTKTLVADVNMPAAMVGGEAVAAAIREKAGALLQPALANYEDGAKSRYDMPAMLSVAVGYDFTDQLRATLEYHFFDDKNAKTVEDRQKALTRGTHEYLGGVEYDINKKFTVSAGVQRTNYGLSDEYQRNTSFACDSWSVGFGGAVNINEHVRINAGYFCTIYSDYTVASDNYHSSGVAGSDTYSRTNNVIGVGVDYKF